MSRRFLIALACLLPMTGRAEMLTEDVNGVTVGMTPEQVIAVLKANYAGDPVVATQPCASGERYARTCVTSVVAGPVTDQTSVFFVEDRPKGVMRSYAAVSITLSQPWTERDAAAWETLVSRDLGQPDCVQFGGTGRFRAWSRAGTVADCAGVAALLPESDDVTLAGTRMTERLIWEFQASTGRLHQVVLIDVGYYQARKR